MAFVRRKGTQFVLDDKPILFAGIGIGSWLNMEHFMLGLPTTHKRIREACRECFGTEREQALWEDFVFSFCREEDFAFLHEMGINLIRVPFHYGLFLDDDTAQIREEGFLYFDRLLSFCRKYEIYLLPDLHAVPGGQNPDWHSDNQTGIPQFWHFKVFQNQAVQIWQAIAKRYAEEEYLLGYDLLNEPYLMPAHPGRLQGFYEEVTKAVRQADNNHLIFLEGDFFAMDFRCLTEIPDGQTALTFHYYPSVWDPSLSEPDYPREKRRERFEEGLKNMLLDMRRFGRPLLCGEAGYDIAGHRLSHVMEMVEDTLDVFIKYGISWTLWSYKDAQFMGLVYPKDETPWMRFASKIREKWTHYREMSTGERLVEETAKLFGRELSEEWKYRLQFRQRALLSEMQKELLLKPLLLEWGYDQVKELPSSLRFENCDYHKEYRGLLSEYARRTEKAAGFSNGSAESAGGRSRNGQ